MSAQSNGETDDDRKLLILYGSETGNSEDMAKRIGWDAMRRVFSVTVKSCDDYRVGNLVNEDLVLFICSTTGQGEEPNNMKKFWKFIRRKNLPQDSLSSVHTAVIGFGDSSYLKYNFIAKKLYKRLQELGANMIADLVLGDDQHELGPEATITPWLTIFWENVDAIFPLSDTSKRIKGSDELFNSTFTVQFVDDTFQCDEPKQPKNPNAVTIYDQFNPFMSTLISNERVTAHDHFQDVRLIKLEISEEPSLIYKSGDVCVVHPQNSAENVHQFISLLNLDANQRFILSKNDPNWMSECAYNYLPIPCTVMELVTNYFDIQSIPKRSFFELLWHFSAVDLERNKLKEFASSMGTEELYEYCNRPRRNILEILLDFPHTIPHIPFHYIFDLIPAIRPRSFSIASSIDVCPKEIQLLVAVVNYRTRLKKPRLGLCSNYLANLIPHCDTKVPISVRRGNFTGLAPDSNPIILIGPGTGVAPFRSFIQERAHRLVSNNFLFFGCRNRNGDFYFQKEWDEMKMKQLLNYYAACSRDNPEIKYYVQNLLWDERKIVWDLISKSDAWIYIAGNAKQMPLQVRETIVKIIEEEGDDQFKSKAENIVKRMELNQRLQYECWS